MTEHKPCWHYRLDYAERECCQCGRVQVLQHYLTEDVHWGHEDARGLYKIQKWEDDDGRAKQDAKFFCRASEEV